MPDSQTISLIRQARPLLHCVSNVVSANDCANLALAVGASPMMAQAREEAEDVSRIAAATVINTGTPDSARFSVCRAFGAAAQAAGHPIVLDPVGVGASSWRLAGVTGLLEHFRPTILRVNLGEAMALDSGSRAEQGVDSVRTESRDFRLGLAARLAGRLHTAVLLSGEEDIVHDGRRAYAVTGGSARMSRVTGAGCMLSVLCGAFAAVEPDPADAAALAAGFWKLCAEHAEAASQGRGIGSFRTELMNAAELLTPAELEARRNIRPLAGPAGS